MTSISDVKVKYTMLIISGAFLCIASCKNVASGIGDSFFQSHANVVVTDTLTASLETVYLDSITTSGTGVILLGNYDDSICGDEEASSYFQLGAPTVQSITPTAIYDSLSLILRPNAYTIGDTTQNFGFEVHQLKALITPPGNGTALYNTSSFSYDPLALGTWKGRIYPTRTDSVSVRLSDELGRTLFSAIVNHPNELSGDNLFVQNYLKGLVLTAVGDKAIFGFPASDSSGFMRLYYHYPQNGKTILYTDFKITQRNLQFNHVTDDRSHTALRDLNSGDKALNATLTNQQSVLQPLSNLAIRINFPYLQNLEHLGRYVEILSAQITLKPQPGTYSATRPLPAALSLCEMQNYYDVMDSLSGANGVEHGNLVSDYAYSNSYYTYDITSYIIKEIGVTNNNSKTRLLLIPPSPDYHTTFQRLVLGSQRAKSNGLKVSVELVIYNVN